MAVRRITLFYSEAKTVGVDPRILDDDFLDVWERGQGLSVVQRERFVGVMQLEFPLSFVCRFPISEYGFNAV